MNTSQNNLKGSTDLFEVEKKKVIDFFKRELSSVWEIYIDPYLNGLNPDIVLINPFNGIAVFKIKNLNVRTSKSPQQEINNVIEKNEQNRDEIYEIYCPRLINKDPIISGLIITESDSVQKILEYVEEKIKDKNKKRPKEEENKYLDRFKKEKYKYLNEHPIVNANNLTSKNDLFQIFSNWKKMHSITINEMLDDFRGWIRESAYVREHSNPLTLNSYQKNIVTERRLRYRRIKGPAGSGKSLIVAARAAELADLGMHVLVVCYNITLIKYLRDLSSRHNINRSNISERRIEFFNFHSWCRHICIKYHYGEEYNELWRNEFSTNDILTKKMPKLVQQVYQKNSEVLKYDAILVDEGQDFYPIWWQALRDAVKKNGEMILAADKTQNIYSTATLWTNRVMTNAGFRGVWNEPKPKTSRRLPPKLIPYIQSFSDDFLDPEASDIPNLEEPNQLDIEDMYPVYLRWVEVLDPNAAEEACFRETCRMMYFNDTTDTSIADIAFLVPSETMAKKLIRRFEYKNVDFFMHTFGRNKQEERRMKVAFSMKSSLMKLTTLHSFKGLEARLLLIYLNHIESNEDKALFYTALTRLLQHQNGSCLTVISRCGVRLQEFGKTWPDYSEYP